jgi:NAD(P)-dependent dehydrogenase (short-subunit alcohol dehydrogenase family)
MSKVWLITGASRGFGRALVDNAIAHGDTVVAAVRRVAALDEVASRHRDQLDVVALDVTDTAACASVVDDVVARHGRIDVLVNNAGRTHIGAVEEDSDASLRALFDLHLFGPTAMIRAVLPHMRDRGSGSIVQMSSMGGQLSFPGFGAYSATKAALEGLSEALAAEVEPFGIRVLIVQPGSFRTGLFGAYTDSEVMPEYAETVGPTRSMVRGEGGRQPGDPAKAAAAIRKALDAESTPLRLPLGGDAVDALVAHGESMLAEISAWEETARATGFDQ